jgi:mono/diheme cytochrome c family protein
VLPGDRRPDGGRPRALAWREAAGIDWGIILLYGGGMALGDLAFTTGLAGGGPMNDQQIDTLIAYMKYLQIPRENCGEGEDDPKTCASGNLPADERGRIAENAEIAAKKLVADGKYATVDAAMGEALFNLSYSAGAYSCARCHTQGWSYGEPGVTGQGAFGWNLTGGATAKHFADQAEMVAFIKNGSEFGKRYGAQGQGSGRMPGYGSMLTDEQITSIVEYVLADGSQAVLSSVAVERRVAQVVPPARLHGLRPEATYVARDRDGTEYARARGVELMSLGLEANLGLGWYGPGYAATLHLVAE